MSENIDNEPAVEDAPVEETAPVTEPEAPAEEALVAEAPVTETPVVVAPVVQEPVKPVIASVKIDENAGTIAEKSDTVTVYAIRAVELKNLGKSLTQGFNVIPTSEARSWLSLSGVRPATPAEIAKGTGK